MPFGIQPHVDGVTFRLWAPAAHRVDLVLHAAPQSRLVSMTAVGDGWFEQFVTSANSTTRYLFQIDAAAIVPDPASRFNPDGVHGPSLVTDPQTFCWRDLDWRGRPWEEAVIYELHVGTFSTDGTFAETVAKLDALADMGVTAIELMPVAAFAGKRGWGYDGVLPFAPAACYGRPDDLKLLVQAAHARRMMVLLDVVYDHLGPDGNYLPLYAPQFLHPIRRTPWGAGINFDGAGAETVRAFFVHNALYWIEEFHIDGLRLVAADGLGDAGEGDFVEEIARAIAAGPGRERHVHLVLENDRNETRRLERDQCGRPRVATAQWNDDLQHAAHVLLTAETGGRLRDYAKSPASAFGRALAEGFVYQGQIGCGRGGPRGAPSAHLPPAAFVSYLQSHDQVGNRVFGERITQLAPPHLLRVVIACWLMAPVPPMLWMGEEWGATTPFLFFCDFGPELAARVAAGRCATLARSLKDSESDALLRMPHPNDIATFVASKLDWAEAEREPHRQWREMYRSLLQLRRKWIMPRLFGMRRGGTVEHDADARLRVGWTLGDSSVLTLDACFPVGKDMEAGALPVPRGEVIHEVAAVTGGPAGGWSARWSLAQST